MDASMHKLLKSVLGFGSESSPFATCRHHAQQTFLFKPSLGGSIKPVCARIQTCLDTFRKPFLSNQSSLEDGLVKGDVGWTSHRELPCATEICSCLVRFVIGTKSPIES